jgi:hypothetical protein
MQTPIPSMILRDTSIREPSSSSSIKDSQASSSYFRGSSYNNSISNSGYNSSTYSSRERDCSSPFLNTSSSGGNSPSYHNIHHNNQLSSLGSRENNSIILRDSGVIQQHTPRVASNRFLSGGLCDTQRIIKQSTEDCRRLLQQVCYANYTISCMRLVCI